MGDVQTMRDRPKEKLRGRDRRSLNLFGQRLLIQFILFVEMPVFGRGQQIFKLCTWLEPGKAGEVIRGQPLDLGLWGVSGIVNDSNLAVDHATARPTHFVIGVIGKPFSASHKHKRIL